MDHLDRTIRSLAYEHGQQAA